MTEDHSVGMTLDTSSKTVLVVDDNRENLTVLGELLKPHYRVRVANSGQRALEITATAPRPDLILLDVTMPTMDGYEVLRHLRANPDTHEIPVIFVTAMNSDGDEERGLLLGAVDYVTKPIRPAILLARVGAHLELKQARDWLRDQNGYLEAEIALRMEENELIKDVSLHALATLAEKRDNETGNHLHRTQAYIEALMDYLKEHPRFREALKHPRRRIMIAKAAPLHDIGKVGIPDSILLKPGKLTVDEFEIMKTHSRIGGDAISDAIQRVTQSHPNASRGEQDSSLAFLEAAREIALYHHERWDGSGYPEGLAGDDIPLAARLMALADVFDALSCRRHYKEPFPQERCTQIISEGRGTHFDPDIVDAFLALRSEFVTIALRYEDSPH